MKFLSAGRRSGWLLTGFIVLLLVHFAEHAIQMWQIHGEHVHRKMATAILGEAWPWGVQTEVLHFGFAAFMLLGLLYFRPQFADYSWTKGLMFQSTGRKSRAKEGFFNLASPMFWMYLTLAWQGVHMVEHTALFIQYLQDVPRTGLFMERFDLVGNRAEMHFAFTLGALVLMLRGMWLNWLTLGWSAWWNFTSFLRTSRDFVVGG